MPWWGSLEAKYFFSKPQPPHESCLWVNVHPSYKWIHSTSPVHHWGEVTHEHDSWVVHHQVDHFDLEHHQVVDYFANAETDRQLRSIPGPGD